MRVMELLYVTFFVARYAYDIWAVQMEDGDVTST